MWIMHILYVMCAVLSSACAHQQGQQMLEEEVEALWTELDMVKQQLEAVHALIDGQELVAGPPGARGERGRKGAKGDRGPRGRVGPRGPPGTSAVQFPWEDVEIDPCTSSPCINGGTCETSDTGVSSCRCPVGFIGAYCDIECRVMFGAQCLFLTSDTLSWQLAVEACVAMHGRLAEVTTQALSDAISGIGENMWLGGHDQTSEGSWVWQGSNTGFVFTDWADGEPGEGNCLQTDASADNRWRAHECAARSRGLCEVDLSSAGQPTQC